MKYDCELIQDLLSLYEEDLCSAASRKAVEEHLQACAHCRGLTAHLPIEAPEDSHAADRAVKQSIHKVRRHWLISLLAAMLIVPVLLLTINQFRGCGLCFTNPDEVLTAWQFMHALETRDWEKAAGMHNFAADYKSIIDALSLDVSNWSPDPQQAQEFQRLTQEDIGWVADLTEDEFIEEMTRRYTDDLRTLDETVTFDCTGYRGCDVFGYGDGQAGWRVSFAVTVTQNGKTEDTELQIRLTDGKIDSVGFYSNGIQWLDTIERALYPSAHAGY